jgi:hypothetical protein
MMMRSTSSNVFHKDRNVKSKGKKIKNLREDNENNIVTSIVLNRDGIKYGCNVNTTSDKINENVRVNRFSNGDVNITNINERNQKNKSKSRSKSKNKFSKLVKLLNDNIDILRNLNEKEAIAFLIKKDTDDIVMSNVAYVRRRLNDIRTKSMEAIQEEFLSEKEKNEKKRNAFLKVLKKIGLSLSDTTKPRFLKNLNYPFKYYETIDLVSDYHDVVNKNKTTSFCHTDLQSHVFKYNNPSHFRKIRQMCIGINSQIN